MATVERPATPSNPYGHIGQGVIDEEQCAACGRLDSAHWSMWVESDALRDLAHQARFRLCTHCYRRLMTHMLATPDADPARPLRGYT